MSSSEGGPELAPSPWVVNGPSVYYKKGSIGLGTDTPSAMAGATAKAPAGGAPLNLVPGTAPVSPVNGDVWTTSTGLYVRIDGVTVGLALLVYPTLALAAAQLLASSLAVQVLGYAAVGDGGAAIWVWSAGIPAHSAYVAVTSPLGGYLVLAEQNASPEMIGGKADGSTDNITIFRNLLTYCYAAGAAFVANAGTYYLSDYVAVTQSIKMVGQGIGVSIFLYSGLVNTLSSWDFFIFSAAPLLLNGITFDGNRQSGEVRTSRGHLGAVVGIHGDMTGSGAYISNGRIGSIEVRNSASRAGFIIANVQNFEIDYIKAENIWGQGTQWAGFNSSTVRKIRTVNTGDLQAINSRIGQAVAIFPETGSDKQPTVWWNNSGILQTQHAVFDDIDIYQTTDSACYVHDYNNGNNGPLYGTDGVTIHNLTVDTSGKDAYKAIDFALNVVVHTINARRVAYYGTNFYNWASRCRVGLLIARQIGYDAIGDILGTPGQCNWTNGANNGIGQSFNIAPAGYFMQFVSNCGIDWVDIDGVARAPYNNIDGYGGQVLDSVNCFVSGIVKNTDRAAGYFSNWQGGKYHVHAENVCLYQPSTDGSGNMIGGDRQNHYFNNSTGAYCNNIDLKYGSYFNSSILTDTGAANAYVVAPVPSIDIQNGARIYFSPANGNTGASTLNGLPITDTTGAPLASGALFAAGLAVVAWSTITSSFQLLYSNALLPATLTSADLYARIDGGTGLQMPTGAVTGNPAQFLNATWGYTVKIASGVTGNIGVVTGARGNNAITTSSGVGAWAHGLYTTPIVLVTFAQTTNNNWKVNGPSSTNINVTGYDASGTILGTVNITAYWEAWIQNANNR